jgi:hypothetical protein
MLAVVMVLWLMMAVQVIQQYNGINAVWMPDVVGRAYGNRGNARSRQVGVVEDLKFVSQK